TGGGIPFSRAQERQHSAAGKLALSCGGRKKRRPILAPACVALRWTLCERRLRRGASRARVGSWNHEVCEKSSRRFVDGTRTVVFRQSHQQSRAAISGHTGRRESIGQNRSDSKSDENCRRHAHWRRHGLHFFSREEIHHGKIIGRRG